MIRRISTLFHKRFGRIGQAAFVLASFTLLVQVFGLVRDRLLAGMIGPGVELDLYNTAFLVPDLVFALGSALVSVTILMPFLAERERQDELDTNSTATHEFLNSIFTTFFIGIILISGIVYLLMPILAPLVAPGFEDPLMQARLVQLSRTLLLSPILLGLSNLLGTITQLHKKFFVYAFSPVLYNIGIILGIIFLYPGFGIVGITYGVIAGALMHFLIQVPTVLKMGLLPRPTLRVDWRSVWNTIRISLPRTLALSFGQIVLVVLYALASKLEPGSISVFKFAVTLHAVPIAIIGRSYSVAAFPTLVSFWTRHNHKEFANALIDPARKILFWSMPVITLFIVLRAQIVRVILGTGAFDWNDTRLVAAALAILVLGVAARGLSNLLVRVYYAAGNTVIPLLANTSSSILIVLLAYVFTSSGFDNTIILDVIDKLMRVNGVIGTEILLLASAYTVGSFVNVFVLWGYLKFSYMKNIMKEVRLFERSTYEGFFGAILIGFVSYAGLQAFDPWFSQELTLHVLLHGLLAGLMGMLFGAFYLTLLKNESWLDAFNAITHALSVRKKKNK